MNSPPSTAAPPGQGHLRRHHTTRVRYRFLRLADGMAAAPLRPRSRWSCAPAVIMIRRLLCMDTPTVVDDIWLPGASFLTALTANKAPMYGLFESEFGVSMVRADEKLRAVAAPKSPLA